MANLSKAEYLKRYMSASETSEGKKKKKKKLKTGVKESKIKIFDDDIDLKAVAPTEEETEAKEEELMDDAPTVADIIDERPDHVKQIEGYRQSTKWKTLQDEAKALKRAESARVRHDSDSDASPPHRVRHDSDASPPRITTRHDSDSDNAPPRRKQRHDSGSDNSPPRKRSHKSDSDTSPLRNRRHDSDSDNSPPRKGQKDNGSSRGQKNKSRHDSNSDASPPRKNKSKPNSDSDNSPPRKKRDSSATRRARPDSDASPPRRKLNGSDQSPPRKGASSQRSNSQRSDRKSDRHSTNKRHSNSDSSPPRKGNKLKDKKRKSRWEDEEEGKMRKTLGGAKAGLSSALEMREEMLKLRAKEDEVFKNADEKLLGKGAATVVRGKKKTQEELEKEELDAEHEKKKAEIYKQWGKGLAQQQEQAQRVQEAIHEAAKPLARYRDDEDLDAMLKSQDREGDPMLAFIKKKKDKQTKKEKPVYRGPQPPPNRFNIPPGYRWDGVDRSTGFEKQFFQKLSDKKAVKDMAYKWSVEDM